MAYTSTKLKVDVDLNKNRLYFTIARKLIKTELDKFYTDLRFCVDDLQPNFDVIGDFSECDIMYLNSTPTFKNIMRYLITKRIREKIRVVKDNLLYKQLRNFTLKQGIYEPNYVYSLQQAEENLSRSQRRNGLRIYLRKNIAEYLLDDEKGEGHIIDMSTSGCALKPGILQPSVDEEILLMIALKNREASLEEFKIKAKVARVESDMFAVKFMDLDDDQKDQLWNCLLYESELIK